MNRLALFAMLALTLIFPRALRAAPSASSGPDSRFREAAEAFDAGEFQAAVDAYTGLLDDGWVSASLLYNLGNAWYRLGDAGQAVLHFRRAWRLAPRDADIRHNIAHALDQAEAVPPDPNPIEQLACLLPRSAWAWAAAAAYWTLAALLGLSFLVPRARPWFHAAMPPGALVLLLSLAGVWIWSHGRPGREYVIVADDQQALYAPLQNAQPYFELPAGSIVTRRDAEPGWLRVSLGGSAGWIPAAVCTRVDDAPYL